MSVRLFVGNLPYSATEVDIRQHFGTVGDPLQIVIPTTATRQVPVTLVRLQSKMVKHNARPPHSRAGFSQQKQTLHDYPPQ